MLNRRSLFAALAAAALSTPFFASGALAASSTPVIRVGINPGGQAEIMEVVKKNAEKLGLQIKVFEFSDYIAPNVALDTGDIDINSFQHQPYLDRQIKDRHYKIESVAKTIISPLVFFTNKGYNSFKDIPNGSKIAIPNDATNEGRASDPSERGLHQAPPGFRSPGDAARYRLEPEEAEVCRNRGSAAAARSA